MTKKYSKYHVDTTEKGKAKRTYKGELYDSLTELQFLQEYIEPRIERGEILNYERQKPYILQEGFINYEGKKILPIKYVADYVLYYPNDEVIVIDVKGNPDSVSKIKRKLFFHTYPNIKYIWVCRSIKFAKDNGNWLTYDELDKLRKENKKSKQK